MILFFKKPTLPLYLSFFIFIFVFEFLIAFGKDNSFETDPFTTYYSDVFIANCADGKRDFKSIYCLICLIQSAYSVMQSICIQSRSR